MVASIYYMLAVKMIPRTIFNKCRPISSQFKSHVKADFYSNESSAISQMGQIS